MISKEVITEALRMYPQYSINDKCTGNIQYKPNSNVVHFEVNSNGMSQCNIYELAHKCKDWAYDKHECVLKVINKTKYSKYTCSIDGLLFQSDYEVEAIFKACQWILDNKTI